MRNKHLIIPVAFVAIGCMLALGMFHWTINRVYVHQGQSLMLRYKGPLIFGSRNAASAGHFATDGEVGVLEQLRGPGRHFYCPVWWERTIVDDVVVKTGEIAIVTSKLGDKLPQGDFLVDGDLEGDNRAKFKGIMRKAYGPGRYRMNPYAYEFKLVEHQVNEDGLQKKHSGWVEIPAGYVGVVTNQTANVLADKLSGIQSDVLPPGLYPVNHREQLIDIVEIGYRETSITVDKKSDTDGSVLLDESGEPLPTGDTGIGFPSNDGFPIQLDFTAVWGVMPEDAPSVVRTFGTIEQAEQKVIVPQSESICRNHGSKLGAVELLVGESRQQFQLDTSDAFQSVLQEKDLTLLYGLVRHIYIPQEIRIPIQNGYIADELKLTREQERDTAKTEANLREAETKVELESGRTRAETLKLVAEAIAEGDKEAKEVAAETKQLVAAIDKEVAEIESEKIVTLGEAEAGAQKLLAEATSQKFKLAVEAFGNGDAYNKWQFAEGLPEEIDMRLFYAGEGTLWTDLKGIMPTLPLKQAVTNSK